MELLNTHPIKKSDLGFHGNLFGGKLLAWIDAAAAGYSRLKIYFYLCPMMSKLMKIGLTLLGLSTIGLIIGLALVILMSCVYIAKWIFLKIWSVFF